MKVSTLPPSLIGSVHLGRYVLRPDGPTGISFTLSMYDTAIPTGDGGTWVGYRLYQRSPGGDRKGIVLFENRTQPPSPTRDPADLAKLILDTLAVGPGDLKPDPTEGYTPEQLEFATKYGRAVREAAMKKFGWKETDLKKLRADLEITYTRREDEKAHARHQLKSGVIKVSARTKREAVQEFREAVKNHISMVPDFRAGKATGQLYCLYPHGAEMVIQCLRPQHPDSLVGDAMRFKARDLDDARHTFGVITRGLEAPPEPLTRYIPSLPETVQPSRSPLPTRENLETLEKTTVFDQPLRRTSTKGLPGGILQSP